MNRTARRILNACPRSRSLHGTRVAASFYSLIESAKMAGAEPAAYLREATHRSLREPGTMHVPSVRHG